MRELIKKIIFFLCDIIFFWTKVIPLKKSIIFESNPDFNDETYWLCKKIVEDEHFQEYQIIWILRDRDYKYIPKEWTIKTIQLSPKNIFELLSQQYNMRRTKYIFESCAFLKKYDIRQKLVNVFHGMQMKNVGPVLKYIGEFDYYANGTHYSDDYYTKTIHFDRQKLLHFGMVRNDELKKKTNHLIEMGIKTVASQKVVLWMPTYRQHVVGETAMTLPASAGLGLPYIYDDEALAELNQRLHKRDTILLIKIHQSQVLENIKVPDLSNIRLMTTHELQERAIQLYSIIGETDALITDYSSVYYDYILLDKPIGLACDDIEQYESKVGFIFSQYDHNSYDDNVVGYKIRSIENLIDFCLNWDVEKWRSTYDCDALKARYHDVYDFTSGEKYIEFCKNTLQM